MNIKELIENGIGKKLIVDSNLLILLIIGRFDTNLIQYHKKLGKYDIHDFNFVNFFVQKAKMVYLTPGILSEMSNHLNPSDRNYLKYFNKLLSILGAFYEEYQKKDIILNLSYFKNLGYTDSSIIDLSSNEKCLVLTDDKEMTLELRSKKLDVINLTDTKHEYFFKRLNLD